MINKFLSFISSMKFPALLLLIFAFTIGYATFIENDFGPSSAKALVYNSWWFEMILLLLAGSLILNIFRYNLFRKEKLATLTFHFSFLIIIIGSGITRYTGYEGMMMIEEYQSENEFLSDETFLQIKVNDTSISTDPHQFTLDKKLHLSGITKRFDHTPILKRLFSNYFDISNDRLEKSFSISYSDFLPNAIDSVVKGDVSGISLSSSSVNDKQGTQVSVNEMINKEILMGQAVDFKNINFTVNNIQDSSVNFLIDSNIVHCISDYDISVTSMPPTGDPPLVYKKGEKFTLNRMSLLNINSSKYMFSDVTYNEINSLFSVSNNMDDRNNSNRTFDALVLDIVVGDEHKQIVLFGKKGSYSDTSNFSLGGLSFSLSYGPKFYTLPFSIKLIDAIVDRYPGTDNASSYASEIIVFYPELFREGYRVYVKSDSLYYSLDLREFEIHRLLDHEKYDLDFSICKFSEKFGKSCSDCVDLIPSDHSCCIDPIPDLLAEKLPFEYRIFMNNILSHKGYRFYQSSIDMENDSWTGLSVNNDKLGTIVTYLGYGLLMLGIVLVFFFKQTRMRKLSVKLKKLKSMSIILFSIFCSTSSYSQEVDFIQQLNDHKIDIKHANKFERILIQDDGGRIKPISTLASEYVRKISRKSHLFDNNASQILLGMMSNPRIWSQVPMIKISHPEIKLILEIEADRVSFRSFFQEMGTEFNSFRPGLYKLDSSVQLAHSISPAKRSKFQNELIKVNERVNIAYIILNTIYHESTLKMFPIQGDSNNSWAYRVNHSHLKDSLQHISLINIYLSSVHSATINHDWQMSDTILSVISKYQRDHGSEVIPADYKIELEVWYNKLNIFSNLFMYYFITGFSLLVLLFIGMFNSSKIIKILIRLFIWLVVLGFSIHVLGLISRWIISGHAPWSDGYESMIYIAFATMVSGLIFLKRSPLTLSVTSLISSMLLMVAHLNWLDPEITNLVPVLNSYWLMIHVSIITASYGFLACGALLGFLSLCLMISVRKHNKQKLVLKIEELTIINEKTITIGLFMLTIGTFLGGIWANESWGRYWGWDPKETWALVSILVYAFILHMRFIPSLKSKYLFNLMSVIGISSIIMTYFGVNYYLSGLHSYAAGDPMPIPVFVYYFIIIIFVTGIIAKIQNNRNKI